MMIGLLDKMALGGMSRFFKFLQEVRVEARKVSWPTRKETVLTTSMVVVMAIIASLFFLIIDSILQKIVAFFLGIGQ
jgi:preprotein translocase subunit SecE